MSQPSHDLHILRDHMHAMVQGSSIVQLHLQAMLCSLWYPMIQFQLQVVGIDGSRLRTPDLARAKNPAGARAGVAAREGQVGGTIKL